MREIYVSLAGDPVHAGDKALTQETPAQRGRVNRYVKILFLDMERDNFFFNFYFIDETSSSCEW